MESLDQVHTPPVSGTYLFHESANLDFLRSVAVLLVFCTHLYDIRTGTGTKRSLLWHLGQLGVLMFFVHTSLVLMWSLERSRVQGSRLFASFYLRRAFRLYPLSIVCVLFAYYFDMRWQPVNLWQNLTLTQNLFFKGQTVFPPTLTPLWSLPLEVEMYVVLPLFFLIFRNRSMKLLVGLWAVAVAVAFSQPQLGDRFLVLRYVPCFLGGVIAWRMTRQGDRARLPGWLWPVAVALVSLIWLPSNERFFQFNLAAFGVCLGTMIPLFREIPWEAAKAVSKIVARYSYGIYLSHFPIMIYVIANARDPWFKHLHSLPKLKHYGGPEELFLVLALTAFASFALYHLIESPGIHLGQRVARWTTSKPNAS